MAWIYFDARNAIEVAEHADYLGRIDAWWAAFAEEVNALNDHFSNRGRKWDLPDWMNEHLGAIDPKLCWEYGRALKARGHRLVITPETQMQLRPLVRSIVDRAPVTPGWEFYDYRPIETFDGAKQIAKVRAQTDITGVLVSASLGEHHRINLKFRFPHSDRFDEGVSRGAGLVTAETLIGEQLLDEWIGEIQAETLPKPSRVARLMGWKSAAPSDCFPLESFKESIFAEIDSITSTLRPKPYHENIPLPTGPNQPIAYTFTRKPKPANDYPGLADIAFASASDHDLWMTLHTDSRFYSNRFSRFGETFCYLKMDGADKTMQARFDARRHVQEALVN